VLRVPAAHAEPGVPHDALAADLAPELRRMAEWLDLHSVEVADRGDLAPSLRRALLGT
jgi:uncharacterized protein YcaQ